jgi:hypothetical protein
MAQVRRVGVRRQAVGEIGIVEQGARAAIVDAIGDFRLLLAGGERHDNGADIGRAIEREHEFHPIADQQSDAVARLQSALTKTFGVRMGRTLKLAPGETAPIADQSLAVGIAGDGIGHERPYMGWAFGKKLCHAVAKARFAPHGFFDVGPIGGRHVPAGRSFVVAPTKAAAPLASKIYRPTKRGSPSNQRDMARALSMNARPRAVSRQPSGVRSRLPEVSCSARRRPIWRHSST